MRYHARLDPQTLLEAYCRGVFPMTDPDGQVRWYTADPRGVLPLDDRFHVPSSLAQFMRSAGYPFEVRINTRFEETMRQCMLLRAGATWISEPLIQAYLQLHELGYAHSVETWREGRLAGGLYGVSIGGAFFGESMFHHDRDASKVALVHLVARLRERNYALLDAQASTGHLRRFGCVEIHADEYLALLQQALRRECAFD
jgi:leucyl/phenylalanyl-tRNA---protein transferase